MKRIWILFLASALALAACGPEPQPTLSAADVQATAVEAAKAMIAETQAAVPPTAIPPTDTPLPTPTEAATQPSLLLPTPAGGDLLSPTSMAVIPPTSTPPPPAGTATCNQPLTKWDGPSAKLTIQNNTKPKGVVTISLFFTTEGGQCGYIGAQFNNVVTLTVPVGSFSAGAFVDGKKDFKVFGSGVIQTEGGYSLWVENDSIILKAGCAPNC
ncbi:MAG: hypothetical protein Fur0043_11960 [Anaerolineales bacterium]